MRERLAEAFLSVIELQGERYQASFEV